MQDLALELFLDTCDTECLDCHVYWPNPNDDTSDKGRFSRSTSEHTPSSLLFLFLSERERSEFAAILNRSVTSISENPEKLAAQCRLLEGQTADVRKLQQLWRDSPTLSNFDYLLLLNLSAGRTFNDLSQWPVFPWVVQDFTSNELLLNYDAFFRDLSKPIGALNEERLAECWDRYKQLEEANEEPFLYGTHYSSPAYCLHFLLRDLPHHALKMQQGKFDKPDRLFSSVSGAFESALSTTSDIKELVPSFFSGPGSFLVNSRGLPLGYKQDGTAVNDVALPTWACSPKKFVEKHACALESEHVSEHLHWWIDLIFGCKQRGQAAIDASNIFHPLSYEDRAKEMLASAEDEQHKKSMMGHINEFGQVPRQLFGDEEAHPKRSTESATRAAEAHPHQNIVHYYPQHRIAIALKAAVG
jgi:factor associated with neutral sphingomyelinase activation